MITEQQYIDALEQGNWDVEWWSVNDKCWKSYRPMTEKEARGLFKAQFDRPPHERYRLVRVLRISEVIEER